MWSKVGQALASVVGLILAAGFVGGSGLMNFAFLSRQAEHANEGLILGAIAVGVTGYNALGPLFVTWAWENGRIWFVAPAGALMWVVFVGFSLLCAVGFTASNRGAVTGSREAEAARLESARTQLKKTEADLAALTRPARAPAVIEEALNGMRQDGRWRSTWGHASYPGHPEQQRDKSGSWSCVRTGPGRCGNRGRGYSHGTLCGVGRRAEGRDRKKHGRAGDRGGDGAHRADGAAGRPRSEAGHERGMGQAPERGRTYAGDRGAACLAAHLKVPLEDAVSDAIAERMVSAGLAKVKPAGRRAG